MAEDPVVTEQQLFQQAVAPPPPEPEPQVAPADSAPPQAAPDAAQAPPQAPPVQQDLPLPEPGIPSWRLREEADARRLAEDRARQLGERLAAIEAAQRQQKPPDFFEDPNAATRNLLMEMLTPFAEQFRKDREVAERQRIYDGQMLAKYVHGNDVVDKAEKAFLDAKDAETLDPVEYERVVQAHNRYDAVVQWHNRQNTLSTVGTNPQAWFDQQWKARLASDPQFQAEALKVIQGAAAGAPSVTRLPPSLSKATAAASNADSPGDMSDRGLFAYAMKR